MTQTSIPQQLKEIHERTKLSRSELAQLLGVSLVAIDQWERGVNAPSRKQRQNISEILVNINTGYMVYKPSVVLQNGSFASRGSQRKALHLSQPDLFTEAAETNTSSSPLPPILSRLKTGIFFADGERVLEKILKARSIPAKTVTKAEKLNVSAGKNTYTYDAHTYHTKVPPQGIVEFLEHYLPNGGLVLDPFSGSGMTGVAARITGMDVILNELSPAAGFISYNFTESISPTAFGSAIKEILSFLGDIRKFLYTTHCRECGKNTEILYTVWSYRVLCPFCKSEFTLWDHCRKYGRTVREHKILKEFLCPACRKVIKKRDLLRTEPVPVLVGYKCCRKTQVEHPPTEEDFSRIAQTNTGQWLAHDYYPRNELSEGVNLNQPRHHGLTSIDRFYTLRNLSAMSQLWREIHKVVDVSLASAIAFVFTSLYQRVTRLSEYRFWGGSGNTARFNVPFIFNEANVFITFERKAASIIDHLEMTAQQYRGNRVVACNSATDIKYLPNESVDLIFTDPPFGANINYSEMNILWESWLDEFTDASSEAIINKVQGKKLDDYEELMAKCLIECYRVLRAGHWMLLVFMNSSGEVWSSLKSAVKRAGFITERLDIFDKQHGTFKQHVSENTAGCDLVLHCRKPFLGDERQPSEEAIDHSKSIVEFIENRDGGMPITAYLHVSRDSEPDLRRLYSEWLAYSLPKKHEIVNFANFREIAIYIIEKMERKDADND